MKRFVVLLCGLMMASGSALAESGWGIYIAHWNAKDLDDGFGPAAKISMEMVEDVQLELRAAYMDSFDAKNQDITLTPLEANLAVQFPGEFLTPYVGIGIGYYLAEGSVNTSGGPSNVEASDEVGYYAVGGVDIGVKDNAVLFAEAKYTILTLDGAWQVPTGTADVELDGIGFNAGLMIVW